MYICLYCVCLVCVFILAFLFLVVFVFCFGRAASRDMVFFLHYFAFNLLCAFFLCASALVKFKTKVTASFCALFIICVCVMCLCACTVQCSVDSPFCSVCSYFATLLFKLLFSIVIDCIIIIMLSAKLMM